MKNFISKILVNRKKRKILSAIKNKGNNIQIHSSLRVVFPSRLSLGDYIYIGANVKLCAQGGITIGDGTVIGENLVVHSVNHNYKSEEMIPFDTSQIFRPVEIGENVWIGDNVIILPGSVIGEGAIIGAGSVVSGIIPDCAIVVGNPCRIVKYRDSQVYFELKSQGKVYLKEKLLNNLKPNYHVGKE